MTRVKYEIKHNGNPVKTIDVYKVAKFLVEECEDYTYETIYEEFDPKDTEEKRAKLNAHADKIAKFLLEKRASA